MANIKVSEMPTATSFNDDDYVMIVQNNTNKKITKENMYTNYIFSTEETRIGKWIDDKPVYRKVITFTTSENDVTGWTDAVQISDNLDLLINIFGYTLFGDNNRNKTPLPRYEGPNYSLIFLAVGNMLKYRSVGFHSTECHLVVEYTKTTD